MILGRLFHSTVTQFPYLCHEAYHSTHLTGFMLVSCQFVLISIFHFSSENLFFRLSCLPALFSQWEALPRDLCIYGRRLYQFFRRSFKSIAFKRAIILPEKLS